MFKVASVARMRQIEAAADAAGLSYASMMENAGRAAAARALKLIAHVPQPRVTVLVGPGNNGGDGLVAARILAAESSAQVRVYLLKKRPDDDPHLRAVCEHGLLVADAQDDQRFRVLQHMVASADLIVDALFGIGIRLPLEGDAARLLQVTNQTLAALRAERPAIITAAPTVPDDTPRPAVPRVLAVDCPSGLDCDSGQADRHVLHADETVTFIAAKPGLFAFPGAAAVGRLVISDIGIPADLPELRAERVFVADAGFARQHLPPRPPDSHKGTYGRALVIAGSPNYIGAAGLSGQAAYRAGVGWVTVCALQHVVDMLAGHMLETTWRPYADTSDAAANIEAALKESAALLIGPGLGQADTAVQLLDSALTAGTSLPTVIDADGLNLLAQRDNWPARLPPNTVLTPHPGEMARLTGLDTRAVQADRLAVCRDHAVAWRAVVVLKGAHTVIANPEGDVAVLPFKTDALATAGTGDVLAGIIVSLLAQGSQTFAAAVTGGYLHGLAGTIAAQQAGSPRAVIAGDIIAAFGHALAQVEAR
jgi:NAD(P)H-hydrate epimerase